MGPQRRHPDWNAPDVIKFMGKFAPLAISARCCGVVLLVLAALGSISGTTLLQSSPKPPVPADGNHRGYADRSAKPCCETRCANCRCCASHSGSSKPNGCCRSPCCHSVSGGLGSAGKEHRYKDSARKCMLASMSPIGRRCRQADFLCGKPNGITFPCCSGAIHLVAFFLKLLGT
jgi:hypothetical protein